MDTLISIVDVTVILAALAGVSWGVIGGALPGVSPSVTMALLLPFTYGMAPTPAIVMLASTYIGAEFGGSVPAILIRTPGTNAAAATVIDGYAMNRQGMAGLALGISLYSGVTGSLFGLAVLVLLAEPLAGLALEFSPPAYFSLGLLGLCIIVTLSGSSLLKGFISAIIGLMIATIGVDPVSGVSRFTFDSADLISGVQPVVVMVGLFALSELMLQAPGHGATDPIRSRPKIRFPDRRLARRLVLPQSIGSVVGSLEGILPGVGGTIASFMSYNEARRWSRRPQEFGKGSPEGIAAPEAANNAVAETALVPLLSLGIPGSNSTAILLGGLLVHGIVPGPMLYSNSSDVVSGLYAGLFFAAVGLLLVGTALLPACIWLVTRPRYYLNAFIFALTLSGIYSINNSVIDLVVMLAAGALGYFMRLLKFPFLPLILGLVLGYLVESNFRRSLVLSGDDYSVFINDRISLALICIALLITVASMLKRARFYIRD